MPEHVTHIPGYKLVGGKHINDTNEYSKTYWFLAPIQTKKGDFLVVPSQFYAGLLEVTTTRPRTIDTMERVNEIVYAIARIPREKMVRRVRPVNVLRYYGEAEESHLCD